MITQFFLGNFLDNFFFLLILAGFKYFKVRKCLCDTFCLQKWHNYFPPGFHTLLLYGFAIFFFPSRHGNNFPIPVSNQAWHVTCFDKCRSDMVLDLNLALKGAFIFLLEPYNHHFRMWNRKEPSQIILEKPVADTCQQTINK